MIATHHRDGKDLLAVMTDPKGGEILVPFAGDWPKLALAALVLGIVIGALIIVMLPDQVEDGSDG